MKGRSAPDPAATFARPEGVEDDCIVRAYRVPPESEGMRVDRFLMTQLRNTSRTRAKSIATRTAYTVEGRSLKPSDRVRAEDRVVLWRPPFEELDQPREVPIVYEDPHLLVVDKPPLCAVHPTARHYHSTVIKCLEAARPGEFLSLIHRIDRETSGLLMLARSPRADSAFKRLLEDRSLDAARGRTAGPAMSKVYLALTWGVPDAGTIELPLEPDHENPLRVKMRVATRGGMPACTRVSVLGVRGGHALVRCELLTGRQHQIRVHLAARGTPLVGDKLYGPDERLLARAADDQLSAADLALLELPRHALHAHHYRLAHAITGEALELVSPLAADLAAFWESRPQQPDGALPEMGSTTHSKSDS